MKLFEAAYPYQDDVLALPVEDIDTAAGYYAKASGLSKWNAKTNRCRPSSWNGTGRASVSP